MRQSLEGRNGLIWNAYMKGVSAVALAEMYDLTDDTVYKIIRQVNEAIPTETVDEIRNRSKDLCNYLMEKTLELVEQEPELKVAANGKVIDGVYDWTVRLAAIQTALKVSERYHRIVGGEQAKKLEVDFGAAEAAQEEANKATERFRHLTAVAS